MKKLSLKLLLISILLMTVILSTLTVSNASYDTVSMSVVEESICTINFGTNSNVERSIISKDLANKEITFQLTVSLAPENIYTQFIRVFFKYSMRSRSLWIKNKNANKILNAFLKCNETSRNYKSFN